MANGVPKREIDVILTDLSTLLDSANTDTFMLRRHEQQVEKLWRQQAIEPVDYYTTKAFIEFGKYNRGASLAAANNALALAPNNSTVQCNVLTTYVGTLEVPSAVSLMKRMASELRDDKSVVADLVSKAADMLQFEMCAQLFEVWDKLNFAETNGMEVSRPGFDVYFEAMKFTGLTDEDTAARLDHARQALVDEGAEVWRTSRKSLDDGSILYFLHVREGAERCAELNFSIAERLVEQFENPGSDFVSFLSRPLSDLAEMFELSGAARER